MAEVAARVSSFYADLMGSFPFPHVSLIPGRRDVSGGGNAGPRVLMLHQMYLLAVPGGDCDMTATHRIVAHELGHLYWSDWVTTEPGFPLGLGLGMWIDRQYARSIDDTSSIGENSAREYVEAAAAGHDTRMDRPAEELRDAPFDVNHVLRHGKGYAIVAMLEYLLGRDGMRALLRDIVARYGDRRGVLSESEFFALAGRHYGADLGWFAHQWLHSNAALDYAVGEVEASRDELRVELRRLGEAVMPVDVLVRATSGQELRRRLGGEHAVEIAEFAGLDSAWHEVVVDADERLPDVDRSNNSKRRETVLS